METCKYCSCGTNSGAGGGNLVIGLLAGAAIGAAVGMLFAPHKGRVTRKIILRKGEDIVDDVTGTLEESISQISDTVTEKLESLKDDLMSRFSSVAKSVTD